MSERELRETTGVFDATSPCGMADEAPTDATSERTVDTISGFTVKTAKEHLQFGVPQAIPIIEREPDAERIMVSGGGKLIVPREDIASDTDVGGELDLRDLQAKKIRKPGRREWIALNQASELPTRLLIHKPKADGIEVEHYYIDPHLRSPIRDELKEVRVFVYYSFVTHSHALWIVNVTIDNSWYESLQPLFGLPSKFLVENAVRVIPDKANSRYRIRHKPMPGGMAWPTKSTQELLGEALGQERFINSADHPIYRDLIDGAELG